jgi:hypothetical protein
LANYFHSLDHEAMAAVGRAGGLARVAKLGRVAACAPARAAWLHTFDAQAAKADISKRLGTAARASMARTLLVETMRARSRARWDRTPETVR